MHFCGWAWRSQTALKSAPRYSVSTSIKHGVDGVVAMRSSLGFVIFVGTSRSLRVRLLQSIGGRASDLLQWWMAGTKNSGLCAGATPRR